ncbi:MAG: protein kinase [Ectothiorhodospiraceae bacterium]|nr:protein kinase [Chromatiales bacterium]MCP5154053.1 protein kinase [Ectothiorhodospiraceae bacterium]
MSHRDALPVGTMLAEYRIEAVLGAGAFGITYRALDTHLDMVVAIKEFFPSSLVTRVDGEVRPHDPGQLEHYKWCLDRFVGEAQVLAHFKHPNIVRVARFFPANGTAYIIMDFEYGQSLATVLESPDATMDEGRMRRIFLPLLEGLVEIHRKRYLHRDIKPANVFVREHDSPILLDFGAAELEMSRTEHDATLLTPGYAPLEQYWFDGREGPPTDLYALGATMYRCIAGKSPPPSVKRLQMIESGAPDPLLAAALVGSDRYSPVLLESVDWMMALEMSNRPRSAAELLDRLRATERSAQPTTASLRRQATQNHKLVFAGPVGAGKTTAIASLSDVPPVATDSRASDMARARKDATTVAMDYGVMSLGPTERVHLYGTPGQERFDFMWEILRKGALGLVLLIDNSRRDPFKDLDFFLNAFRELIRETRLAIGVTRMDEAPYPTIDEYHVHLRGAAAGTVAVSPPVFSVDARERRDVSVLVQALLCAIDPGVEDYRL